MSFVRIALVLVCTGAALAVATSAGQGATSSTQYDVVRLAAPHGQDRGRWGERLAVAGDLNGDKVNDLFVVALQEDVAGVTNAGKVYAMSGADRSILYEIQSPELQTNAQFGFYISSPGDLDGDGRGDVLIGTDAQDVYVGPGSACGQAEPNGCNEDQGKAWAFSGRTGGLLYALDNPDPQSLARFGSRIGTAGEVTGDGVPDVIVGASNNDVPAGCGSISPTPAGCRVNQGQAYIFNGATGALVRRLELPDADSPAGTCTSGCGSFGISVQSPGDTNGDGVADQLVDAGSYSYYTGSGTPCGAVEPNGCNESQGRMYVFSGADGSMLLRIDDPEPQRSATFGFQDAAPNAPGDVNKDGFADLYGNGFQQNGPSGDASEGQAWIFNGKTGAVLYRLNDPTPEHGGQFAFSLSRTDFNLDGTPDPFVGQSPHHEPGSTGSGGTYIFNGADGSLLRAFELPAGDEQPSTPTNLGPNLGWTDAAPGDLNGDGEPDYMAGAPFTDVNGQQDQGRVYLYMSNVPKATATATPTPTTRPTPPTVVTEVPRVAVRRFTARVNRKRDRTLPYEFTVTGKVTRPAGVSRSAGCVGRISVQTKNGKKTISTRRAKLRSDCTAKRKLKFSLPDRVGNGRLRLTVRFLGNKRLKPARAKQLRVRAG